MKAKNALIVGIRNEESICYAIATELKRAGYEIYATYQDEETYESVSRAGSQMGIKTLFPYNARSDEDLDQLGSSLTELGVKFDILVHGISYSTAKGAKLDLPLVQISWEEFTDAIRIGAFSLVELSGKLIDILNKDASIISVSMGWARFAVPGFNIVCATKACLESIIRGLAESLGEAKGIRVNGISPGFVPTHSLSKIGNSLEILEKTKARSPLKTIVQKEDIASLAVSILENRSITSMVYSVDTGAEIMG